MTFSPILLIKLSDIQKCNQIFRGKLNYSILG